jgi:hypothetical protein
MPFAVCADDVVAFLADCRKQCIAKEAALYKAEARCKLADSLDALKAADQQRNTLKVQCHNISSNQLRDLEKEFNQSFACLWLLHGNH